MALRNENSTSSESDHTTNRNDETSFERQESSAPPQEPTDLSPSIIHANENCPGSYSSVTSSGTSLLGAAPTDQKPSSSLGVKGAFYFEHLSRLSFKAQAQKS